MQGAIQEIKRGDILLVLLLLLLSSLGIIFPRIYFQYQSREMEGLVTVIQVDGKEYGRIPLVEGEPSYTLSVEGILGVSQVEICGNRVRMREAPAPDHYRIAVNTGWISRPGPIIVNMPNRVAIWIEGFHEREMDGMTF